MPAITLPDSSVRRFDAPVTGVTVAAAIGPGLARAALAMKLDGKLVDLDTSIDHDAQVVNQFFVPIERSQHVHRAHRHRQPPRVDGGNHAGERQVYFFAGHGMTSGPSNSGIRCIVSQPWCRAENKVCRAATGMDRAGTVERCLLLHESGVFS